MRGEKKKKKPPFEGGQAAGANWPSQSRRRKGVFLAPRPLTSRPYSMSAHIDALKKAILNNLTAGDVPIGLHQFDDVVELHVHGTAKQGDMQYLDHSSPLPLLAILAW